jgi:hypothetical protein
MLQADARRSDRDFAAFIGARFLFNRGSYALSGTGGLRHRSEHSGSNNQLVGEAQAAFYRELTDHSRLAADVAAGRDVDGTYARASAYAQTTMLNARADLLQQFGDHRTTQYAATLDGGLILTKAGMGVAGRDINDTAVTVRIEGSDPGQKFDVLVDEVARGTIEDGKRMLVFLQPFETYNVRLRPRGAQIASFDAAPKSVTLYPGNVAELDWKVTQLFILFGRAVGANGKAIADADIVAPHGIGRTDREGYFQIEANSEDKLQLSRGTDMNCAMKIGPAKPVDGLVSAGDMMCR